MEGTQSTRPVPQPSSAPRVAALRVLVLEGPDRGRGQIHEGSCVVIGRGETAHIRLSDPTVSLCHVELRAESAGIMVRDLGSRNGVRIGDVTIKHAVVQPGCMLLLGATVVRIEAVGDVAAPWSDATSFGGLIGQAPAMRRLYAMLDRLVRTDLSLVIQGETGTGKELAARAIHKASRRAAGPFVVLDCTAIPAGLAPSILFGHERGAFTGASERHVGIIEAAQGGVLFIDEVGELPLDQQALLLRVLQERCVVPVGSAKSRHVDIRVISATWRDLRAMVNAGSFREDLYYRLAQATIWMPSLAERKEDTALLIQHALSNIPAEARAARAITPEALEALTQRAFPGNVRELKSTVERLAVLADGPLITTSDLTFERLLGAVRLRASTVEIAGAELGTPVPLEPFKEAKRTLIDEFERAYLIRLLERTGNNLSRAAAIASLERHNLRDLLKKHHLYERE